MGRGASRGRRTSASSRRSRAGRDWRPPRSPRRPRPAATAPRSISGRSRSRNRSYGEPLGGSPTALGGGAGADRLNAGARKGSLAADRIALEVVLAFGLLLSEATGVA